MTPSEYPLCGECRRAQPSQRKSMIVAGDLFIESRLFKNLLVTLVPHTRGAKPWLLAGGYHPLQTAKIPPVPESEAAWVERHAKGNPPALQKHQPTRAEVCALRAVDAQP